MSNINKSKAKVTIFILSVIVATLLLFQQQKTSVSTTNIQEAHFESPAEEEEGQNVVKQTTTTRWQSDKIILSTVRSDQQDAFETNLQSKSTFKQEVQKLSGLSEENTVKNHLLEACQVEDGSTLNLLQAGKYVPIDAEDTARYDAVSCVVMKARYNCVKDPRITVQNDDGKEVTAADYKFVLQLPHHHQQQVCDLPKYINYHQGPLGVAKAMQKRRKTKDNNVINVMLLGSCIFRQMWESLTCLWKHHITSLKLLQNGQMISLAALAARKNHLLDDDEMGHLLTFSDLSQVPGCHGEPTLALKDMYYDPNLFPDDVSSSHVEKCSDDIAMVEFDHAIRFHYIFRPSLYANRTFLYEKLGILNGSADVDAFIFNYNESKATANTGTGFNDIFTIPNWRFVTFRNVIERDVGAWTGGFAAKNPFTDRVEGVDGHACMPGIPDDELNVLLYGLMHDLKLLFPGRLE